MNYELNDIFRNIVFVTFRLSTAGFELFKILIPSYHKSSFHDKGKVMLSTYPYFK